MGRYIQDDYESDLSQIGCLSKQMFSNDTSHLVSCRAPFPVKSWTNEQDRPDQTSAKQKGKLDRSRSLHNTNTFSRSRSQMDFTESEKYNVKKQQNWKWRGWLWVHLEQRETHKETIGDVWQRPCVQRARWGLRGRVCRIISVFLWITRQM